MKCRTPAKSFILVRPRRRMLGCRLGPANLHLASLAVLAILLTFPLPASAFDLSYGGRLAGPTGEPLAGPVDLTFRFYRDPSGGSALVTVSVPNVPLADGIFQVGLPIAPTDAELLFEDGDQTIFVEVESQGKIYPRQKFSYVPLALRVPVDGAKIVYDSQGRLTLGEGVTSGTLPGVSGTGGIEKTSDQSYATFSLSSAGKSLIGAATPAAQRTILGLGTMAERSSITPADISTSNCPDGSVLRKGTSSWACETLSSSSLSSLVSQTEFDYLDGVTSPIQTQLNSRLSSAGGTLSGSLTLNQGSELRLATTNAGISAGFKAPANLPTSVVYTLPSGLPADGQMLTSSSSGLLSWSNVPVTAVNGQIGNVSLNADNINETSSRKYYSHTLARQALSSIGLLSYNSSTGVMSLSDTLLTKSGGTMTGSLDFGGALKVTNLADPTSDGDAAKKAYVDGKLGGQPLVVGTPSPGQVIKWDGSKFALATDAVGVAGGGIATLNTLTSGSQSLAVETPGVTTGTRPSWAANSGTSTHTLSIPMASANDVTAGLISKADYNMFSGKQDGITPSSTIVLGSVSTNLQNALEIKAYGTSAGQTSEIRFRELSASGINYVGLKSPDNLVTNTIWTLPSGDGTSGFVLSTDGSGTLSWISPTTGSVTSIVTGTGLAGGPISGIGTISLANVGTPGTYAKVTTNDQGQVISGSSLVDTDIPSLSAAKITSGTLSVEQGGTGAATAQPFFVLAGPGVGPTPGAPSFRTLVAGDIPSLDASKITSGTLSNSLINWAAAPVTTVAGRTGAVTLLSTDISGLGSLATVDAVSGGTGGTITDDTITNADINSNAAIADSKLATIATSGKVANSATTATSEGTANAIVARDGSGNFTAGTITATLNGNATNVSGTVALTNGGTGATTAAGARTNLGLGTAAILDVGTAANNILQLDGSGKLPVVDGSQLAGVVKTAGNSTMIGTLTLPANGLVAGTNQLVLSGGNVGIGTTAPASMLSVAGSTSISGKTSIGAGVLTGQDLPLNISGTPGLPANSGSTQTNGSLRIGSNTGNSSVLDIGILNAAPWGAWLQAANWGSLGTPYALILQPNGGAVGIGTTAPTGLLDIGNGNGTSYLVVSATTGPGTVLGTSNTNNATVPKNGTAKVCKVNVTTRAGQSVMVYGHTTWNNNGANYAYGSDTQMWLARGGSQITPFKSSTTALYTTTHTQTWVEAPGAGTFEYAVYGAEINNRTTPVGQTCFIQVTSMN